MRRRGKLRDMRKKGQTHLLCNALVTGAQILWKTLDQVTAALLGVSDLSACEGMPSLLEVCGDGPGSARCQRILSFCALNK